MGMWDIYSNERFQKELEKLVGSLSNNINEDNMMISKLEAYISSTFINAKSGDLKKVKILFKLIYENSLEKICKETTKLKNLEAKISNEIINEKKSELEYLKKRSIINLNYLKRVSGDHNRNSIHYNGMLKIAKENYWKYGGN
jgi:hypothetical protein